MFVLRSVINQCLPRIVSNSSQSCRKSGELSGVVVWYCFVIPLYRLKSSNASNSLTLRNTGENLHLLVAHPTYSGHLAMTQTFGSGELWHHCQSRCIAEWEDCCGRDCHVFPKIHLLISPAHRWPCTSSFDAGCGRVTELHVTSEAMWYAIFQAWPTIKNKGLCGLFLC